MNGKHRPNPDTETYRKISAWGFLVSVATSLLAVAAVAYEKGYDDGSHHFTADVTVNDVAEVTSA